MGKQTALDRVLAGLDLEVSPFAICALADGHSLALPAQARLSVHYTLAGRGRIHLPGRVSVDFERETAVICPAGLAQRIEARYGEPGRTRCVEAAPGLNWLATGQPPFGTVLACGHVAATETGGTIPFQGLSEPLVEPAPADGPLGRTLRALLAEVAAPDIGGQAMAASLMKQALILLLRQLISQGDERLPWLRAVGDPQIGPVAAEMLSDPAQAEDLEELSRRAGVCRSTFVARFQALFGTSPHAFLTAARMQRAARLLKTTDLPVKTVADRVGYRSRSHFTRSFKNRFGTDPVAWRRDGPQTKL